MIDELSSSNGKYINVLIGILDNQQKIYLVETIATKDSVDDILITQILNYKMHSININKNCFILLISDAARYMTKATQPLKILLLKLLHITCTLHLLHNCALKVKFPPIN